MFSEYRISPKQLKGLKSYKYASETNSLLDNCYVMPAFWNFLERLVPRSMSPNTVTLSGLIVNLMGFAPLMWISYDMKTERPTWSLLLCVFCSFFYNTMDNIDGRHARALGGGSVIGELFDHGIDSFANILQIMPAMVAMRAGLQSSLLGLTLVLLVDTYSLTFFCRKLVLSKIQFSLIDTTELQFLSFGGVLLTVVLGSDIWDTPFHLPVLETQASLRLIFMLQGVFLLSLSCFNQIYQQLQSPKRGKLFYPYMQCIFIWIYSFLIFNLCPSVGEDFIIHCFLIGGAFSKLITESVFSSTGVEPNRSWVKLEFAAPILVLLNCLFNFCDQTLLVSAGAIFTSSLWLFYFYTVVTVSADYLGLSIFSVKKLKL